MLQHIRDAIFESLKERLGESALSAEDVQHQIQQTLSPLVGNIQVDVDENLSEGRINIRVTTPAEHIKFDIVF